MRIHAAVAFLAAGFALTAPVATRQADTNAGALKRDIRDLKYTVIDLRGGAEGLRGGAEGTAGTAGSVSGRVEDLSVKETPTEIRIDLNADVLFDFDKADIKPGADDALKRVADLLRQKAAGAVHITGFTDAKGSSAYNERLSLRRAESVRNWLADKEGLKTVSFVTRGGGASNPVAPNTRPDGSDNPEGRQKNRRVEIVAGKR